jgi:hypothetical protein
MAQRDGDWLAAIKTVHYLTIRCAQGFTARKDGLEYIVAGLANYLIR